MSKLNKLFGISDGPSKSEKKELSRQAQIAALERKKSEKKEIESKQEQGATLAAVLGKRSTRGGRLKGPITGQSRVLGGQRNV